MEHGSRTRLVTAVMLAVVFASGVLLGLHRREVSRVDREDLGRLTAGALPGLVYLDGKSPDQGDVRITPAVGIFSGFLTSGHSLALAMQSHAIILTHGNPYDMMCATFTAVTPCTPTSSTSNPALRSLLANTGT